LSKECKVHGLNTYGLLQRIFIVGKGACSQLGKNMNRFRHAFRSPSISQDCSSNRLDETLAFSFVVDQSMCIEDFKRLWRAVHALKAHERMKTLLRTSGRSTYPRTYETKYNGTHQKRAEHKPSKASEGMILQEAGDFPPHSRSARTGPPYNKPGTNLGTPPESMTTTGKKPLLAYN
jgi:hypothetical protein